MNVLQYLNNLRPALPLSSEKSGDKINGHSPMTNGELRRLIQSGAVLINGERVSFDEEVDFPVFSLVFFPKSATKRTTLV